MELPEEPDRAPWGHIQFPYEFHFALVDTGRRLRLHMLQRIAPPLGTPVTFVNTRCGLRLHILRRVALPLRSPGVQVEVPRPAGTPKVRQRVSVAAPRGESLLPRIPSLRFRIRRLVPRTPDPLGIGGRYLVRGYSTVSFGS